MMLTLHISWGNMPLSQHWRRGSWRWLTSELILLILTTFDGMPSFPTALLHASESVAFSSFSKEVGLSSSLMTGSFLMLFLSIMCVRDCTMVHITKLSIPIQNQWLTSQEATAFYSIPTESIHRNHSSQIHILLFLRCIVILRLLTRFPQSETWLLDCGCRWSGLGGWTPNIRFFYDNLSFLWSININSVEPRTSDYSTHTPTQPISTQINQPNNQKLSLCALYSEDLGSTMLCR